jgi:hypothetical protein
MLLETGGVEIEDGDNAAHRFSQADWRDRMNPPHDE